MERYCNLTLQICCTTLLCTMTTNSLPAHVNDLSARPLPKGHAGARHGYLCTPNHGGTSNGLFHTSTLLVPSKPVVVFLVSI
ncbi:uncharacterized protein B0T23DRAFT_246756 [Neurospora hispaniola]|uniref:Uncharacterized protein n=1 Tax=Neurospora hispaniola TaxID=588809 RepID=A0AAJ0I0H6_9PEZI|nr:hypothetical protein B0T23DRAFT_246756 [Neurospora hispaniola]